MKVTLRKLNAERKLLDKSIARLVCDIQRGEKPLIGVHRLSREYMGIISIEQFKTNCVAAWQSLNDMIVRRSYLNEKNMLAYGGITEAPSAESSLTVVVPKFIGFDKKTNETEVLTIAQAISRKKWFEDTVKNYLNSIRKHIYTVESDFINNSKSLEREMVDLLNSQFGPESTHTSKQRIEFRDSIKPQYSLEIIDPLNIKEKVENAYDSVTNYLVTVDSLISRATETTEVEIDG